jgi:hypothetical protein
VIDTTILPGRRDFTPYTTPGACLQAAMAVEHIVTRAALDTTPYTPEQDTMSSTARATAKACGTRFTVTGVPPSELIDLMHLALVQGNDSQAAAAAERYIATFSDPEQRRWALVDVDTSYFYAKPMRLAAVESIIARLDSLGAVAALQRGIVHNLLFHYAQQSYDVPRIKREAIALMNAAHQLQGRDLKDRARRSSMNPLLTLFLLELYQSPTGALERAIHAAQPAGLSPETVNMIRAAIHTLKIDWALAQIGKPIPSLNASYWPGTSSARKWPVPGKVSILIHGDPSWDPETAAMWRRLIHKYGEAINVTIMCQTRGFFHDGPPLSPTQEAERLNTFFRTDLQLPVTVVVDTTTTQRLPDGRRMQGQASFEQDPYYHWGFIMTDTAGKIVFLGMSEPTNSEKGLQAWIDRALGK